MTTITTDIAAAIWGFDGRPCVVTSETTKTKWVGRGVRRTGVELSIRFLDGKDPRLGLMSSSSFRAKAKRITGAAERVWRRTDDLTQQGMEHQRAHRQALAEVQDGVRF